MKTFLIASTSSGSGKTLVTSLLLDLLKENYSIAAFKAGPDFIDPKFHEAVLASPSYNLDLNLMGAKNTRKLFFKHCSNKDLAVIEGVMGLFDGKIGQELVTNGSSFNLAKVLEIPIILLVDCKKRGQSVIAEMIGYSNLANLEGHELSGIILNKTNKRTYEYLKREFAKYSSVPLLGYVPDLDINLESRHLGLKEPFEFNGLKEKIKIISSTLTKTIDIQKLLEISDINPGSVKNNASKKYRGLKVGIAKDEAFNFYYQDNIDLLEELGCEIVKFSPLHDSSLPEKLDLIYLGGGYPELYLKELNNNKTFKEDLKNRIEQGVVCLAECGGMVYLSNNIYYNGDSYNGLGIFNCDIEFKDHLVRFGYNELKFNDFSMSSHEFHYSDYIFLDKPDFLFRITKGTKMWKDGMRYKNTFGFYPHIHFYSQPDGFKFLQYILDIAYGSNS